MVLCKMRFQKFDWLATVGSRPLYHGRKKSCSVFILLFLQSKISSIDVVHAFSQTIFSRFCWIQDDQEPTRGNATRGSKVRSSTGLVNFSVVTVL